MKSIYFKIPICVFLFCIFLRPLLAAEIHDTLRNGQIPKAMNLLANNPSLVSSKDDDNCTPLHWAIRFRIIKSPTKNVAASFENDSTLLDYAKEYSDKKIVEILIKYGAKD